MIGGADIFLDSNILLYAAGGAGSAPTKHARALEILAEDFCLSAQVLAEFYTNATKKGPKPLSPEKARQWVISLSRKTCQTLDSKIVRRGVDISVRYQTSYWDGAIIAAAERLECATVYSEDFSHGQKYGDVTVINPFI